jgi:hypothetical protein
MWKTKDSESNNSKHCLASICPQALVSVVNKSVSQCFVFCNINIRAEKAKVERGSKNETILIFKSLFTVMDSFQKVESD